MSDFAKRMLDNFELLQRDLEDRSNLVELARLRGLSVYELEQILQRIDKDLHALNRIGVRKGSIPTQRETVDLALKHTPQRT